jgi:hypothetical protein
MREARLERCRKSSAGNAQRHETEPQGVIQQSRLAVTDDIQERQRHDGDEHDTIGDCRFREDDRTRQYSNGDDQARKRACLENQWRCGRPADAASVHKDQPIEDAASLL